jgi:hypothetical protein
MPDDELANKIKQELLKSGFPLEIRCRQLMRRHGWQLDDDRIYLDSDGVEHEIDAVGINSLMDLLAGLQGMESESEEWKPLTLYQLIVECKKNSSDHWVFFEDGLLEPPLLSAVSTLKESDNLRLQYIFQVPDDSVRDHHYLASKAVGSYCMAFKADRNQIYEGLRELLSAFRHVREEWTTTLKPFKKASVSDSASEDSSPLVYVLYPVLVFDGRLFVAELVDGDLRVSETNQVVYSAMHPSYLKTRITVDVIRADVFDNYLTSVEQDMRIIDSYVMARKFAVSTESKR